MQETYKPFFYYWWENKLGVSVTELAELFYEKTSVFENETLFHWDNLVTTLKKLNFKGCKLDAASLSLYEIDYKKVKDPEILTRLLILKYMQYYSIVKLRFV